MADVPNHIFNISLSNVVVLNVLQAHYYCFSAKEIVGQLLFQTVSYSAVDYHGMCRENGHEAPSSPVVPHIGTPALES